MDQSLQYRRKRRSRDDPMERNFLCNCGKSYLSYPALYTHIKTKHQGQAPSPGQVQAFNRQNQIKALTREDPQNDQDKNLSTVEQSLVTMINTFRSYSPSRQLTYTLQEVFLPFPQSLSSQLLAQCKKCLGETNQTYRILDNGIKAVSIDYIFGKYISLLMNKIDKSLLTQLVFIFLIFRKVLNRNEKGSHQYTKQASGLKLLQHANSFVSVYFDIYAKKYRDLIAEPCFIGKSSRQFICLSKFIFIFGRWTFLDRYTNSKIKLNNF